MRLLSWVLTVWMVSPFIVLVVIVFSVVPALLFALLLLAAITLMLPFWERHKERRAIKRRDKMFWEIVEPLRYKGSPEDAKLTTPEDE